MNGPASNDASPPIQSRNGQMPSFSFSSERKTFFSDAKYVWERKKGEAAVWMISRTNRRRRKNFSLFLVGGFLFLLSGNLSNCDTLLSFSLFSATAFFAFPRSRVDVSFLRLTGHNGKGIFAFHFFTLHGSLFKIQARRTTVSAWFIANPCFHFHSFSSAHGRCRLFYARDFFWREEAINILY